MAARKKSLDCSMFGNDFVYDFPCSPCGKDGLNVSGIKYCIDCDENLCSACMKQHSKFASTRGHKVLDQVQRSEGKLKQLPSRRCNKHGGKIVDVFCSVHAFVGCSTCIAVDHRLCKGIQYIPDVSTGIKTSREFRKLEGDIQAMKVRFESLKKQKQTNVKRLKQDKDELQKEIRHVRSMLNTQLDKMEKELLDEADRNFEQKIKGIDVCIAEIDSTLAQLEDTLKNLKNDNQDSDVFVICKIGKQELEEKICPEIEKKEKLLPECGLELNTDNNVKLILEGKSMFASIMNKCTIQKVVYKEDRNIHVRDDSIKCRIYSVCSLSDGCQVMTDYNNKKLKKYNPVSKIVSTLISLPDNPFGLCLVDSTSLAVTLINKKKIQFLEMSDPVKLGRSFSVGDRCRGLTNCDGLLYVCCGGSPFKDFNEGLGHVEIYNCNGELLRCFYEATQCPVYIDVTNNGFNSTMYISDYDDGVKIIGIDGVVKHRFPVAVKSSIPICLINNEHLCIGEYHSGDVYIQTCKEKRVLLKKKDLGGNPVSIYFDEASLQLSVGLWDDDVIKVFDVKM